MSQRRRVKQPASLRERLASFAKEVKEKASLFPPSIEKDALIEKAREAEATVRLEGWANSPGLQPPE
jgi:hypothetical protein